MYIFRYPAAADFKFTFEGLLKYISKGRNGYNRKVGTTVVVDHLFSDCIVVRLYDTVIARIYRNGAITIPEHINNYGSQATSAWVWKVLANNGVPRMVYRENFKYVGVAGETFQAA